MNFFKIIYLRGRGTDTVDSLATFPQWLERAESKPGIGNPVHISLVGNREATT